jgi:hypothetical protein
MPFERRRSRVLTAGLVALLCAGLLAAVALATTGPEQTRESYVARVEPICKTNTKANERILAGVRGEGKEGKAEARRGTVQAGGHRLRPRREADRGGPAASSRPGEADEVAGLPRGRAGVSE